MPRLSTLLSRGTDVRIYGRGAFYEGQLRLRRELQEEEEEEEGGD